MAIDGSAQKCIVIPLYEQNGMESYDRAMKVTLWALLIST
jgi:hypothetical protein